jgi:ABC-2 type transport system ATP-binding protein
MTAALDVAHLGKRYGRAWALNDCTFSLPAGKVAALVGPNGAGKSTLLHLAVGLLRPSAGAISVFGVSPDQRPLDVLPRIGFVAQDHPLYGGFSVADTLTFGRHLNARWDHAAAEARLRALNIPLDRKVSKLSGGQQAQVALTLALAKRPDLVLLDEPLASLDPLARRDLLRVLMEATVTDGLTVLLSSHILSDLERVCDYLILLDGGQTRLAGEIEDIVRTHKRLTGPRADASAVASRHTVISESTTDRQTTLLVRINGHLFDASWEVGDVTLEDIILAYMEQAHSPRTSAPVEASR